ncbi:MAG: transketolase family protein [Candidatus Bipolaricaulia bacterium]
MELKLGEKASLRKAFGEALVELGEEDERVVVLTADLAGSTNTDLFAKRFPERFFNLGITEANMMALAAGLAMSGKRPFVSTFAIFAAGKPWEQVRQAIAYQSAPVRIVATHAGLTVGEDGASHQMLEDINNMRVLPNMDVIVPADAVETKQAILALKDHDANPVYVRLARAPFPVVFDDAYKFEFGRAKVLRQGEDVSLFACGLMVYQSLRAAELLAEKGLSAEVVNVSTIKPLDLETILASASKTKAAVSAEEHQAIGGLGSALAEALAEHCPVPLERVGVLDRFGQSGSAEALIEYYGLTPEGIAQAAIRAFERKRRQ